MTSAGGSRADDELAIQRLVAVYSDAITCRDAAAAAAVFAEDGVLQAFSGPEVVGRDAIGAALGARAARSPTAAGDAASGFSLQLTRFVAVDIDGDIAVGRSHYLEMSRGPDPTATGRLSTGLNEDRYRRGADGWRISHRRIVRTYVGDLDFPGKALPLVVGAWSGGPSATS